MNDPDGIMFLMIFFGVAIVALLVALVIERAVEHHRPDKRLSHVPEWHRRIARNGFKSRMGAR